MDIIISENPFPHVIVKNCYTNDELDLIRQELKFLTKKEKMSPPGIHHGMNGRTNAPAIYLESVYADKNISDILTIFKSKYSRQFVDGIISHFPSFIKLKYINSIVTKVRYYHNGEGYEGHIDSGRDFLAFSYFHTHPKKFSGGELYCPDYDYKIECDDNTLILLPFYIKHQVLPVSISDDEYWSGNGRHCVSQFLNLIPCDHDGKK